MSITNDLSRTGGAEDSGPTGTGNLGDDNPGDNRNFTSASGRDLVPAPRKDALRNMAPTHGSDSGTMAENEKVKHHIREGWRRNYFQK